MLGLRHCPIGAYTELPKVKRLDKRLKAAFNYRDVSNGKKFHSPRCTGGPKGYYYLEQRK